MFPELHEVELVAADLTASETAKGKVIRVPLGELAVERHGMEAHLSFFRIESAVQYDALAAMTENMPGELFYTAIKNVRLEIEDHPVLDNIDGWDLFCDHWLRFGAKYETIPSDVADPGADSLNQTQVVNWLHRFNDPNKAGTPYVRDGLIPMRVFDPKAAQKNVLQFEVGTTFDGFGSCTPDDLGATKVIVGLVYLRELRLPAPSRVYVLTVTDKDARGIEPVGRLEYLAITNRSNSTPSYVNNVYTGFSNIQLDIGGQTLYSGQTLAQIVGYLNLRRGLRGVTSFASGLTEFVAPVITSRLGSLRSEMYRGRVRLNIGTRSNHTETRFLVRETGRKNDAWVTRCLRKMGLSDKDVRDARLDPATGPSGKGDAMDAELDHKVWHPKLGGSVIAQKASARA